MNDVASCTHFHPAVSCESVSLHFGIAATQIIDHRWKSHSNLCFHVTVKGVNALKGKLFILTVVVNEVYES